VPAQATKKSTSTRPKSAVPGTRASSTYHHGDLPQALKRAALEVLAGPDAHLLSFRDLARRLGVTTAAPYHHFKDRTGLLVSLAVDGYRLLHEQFLRAAQDDEAYAARIKSLTMAYLDFARRERGYYTAMFLPEVSAASSPELRSAANLSFELIRDLIAGHNPGMPLEQASERTVSIWSFLHGLVVLSAAGPLSRRLPRKEQDRFAVDSIERWLGNGRSS
jgi:AcrR family transcriptional regulator